jgi:hypothetical protein
VAQDLVEICGRKAEAGSLTRSLSWWVANAQTQIEALGHNIGETVAHWAHDEHEVCPGQLALARGRNECQAQYGSFVDGAPDCLSCKRWRHCRRRPPLQC